MKTYSYINELFSQQLSLVPAIQARFHICPKGGTEINSDDVAEVLDGKNLGARPGDKYPLALMAPPFSFGPFAHGKAGIGAWENYRAVLYFLDTTHYGRNDRKNPDTNTSGRPVFEIWDAMKEAAGEFLERLAVLTRETAANPVFRLTTDTKQMQPVSYIGVDRASGIRLEFTFSIYNCPE